MKRQTLEMQALERRWVDRLASMLLSPLLRGERLSDGWRALSWDAEQGLCLTLVRGDCTLLIELERRDASRDCYAPAVRARGMQGEQQRGLVAALFVVVLSVLVTGTAPSGSSVHGLS